MNSTNEAQKENPALGDFEILIGEWSTEGAHPYMPDTVFHGRVLFEWIEGGAFFCIRSQTDEPGIPSGIAIIGSDDVAKQFFMLYFDERGISRKYDVSFQNRVMTWSRATPEFSQRMVFTISDDGNTIESRGEMSKNGGALEPDLKLIYTRAT